MSTLYNDIFIRKNLNDQGVVPATGVYTQSPDIVPVGTQPLSDPSTLKSNWGSDFGQDIVKNAQNYIYMRGKNLAPGAETGDFYLYYTPATLIMYPFQWLNNQLKTSDGKISSPVSAQQNGEVVYTSNPFTWITSGPSAGDHFCLVSMVDTPNHHKQDPTVANMKDLGNWLVNNPNVAWRNIAVVDQGVNFAMPVQYNQGDTPGLVYIFLDCADLPVGSAISFASGTPLPSGGYVKMDWVTIPKDPNNPDSPINLSFFVGGKFNIAAGWNTMITYNYKSNGKDPGDNFKIELKAAFYEPPGTALDALSSLADQSEHVMRQALEVHQVLSYANHPDAAVGPGQFIGIGSHKTVFKK